MKLTPFFAIAILILSSLFMFATSCKKEHLPEYYFKCKVNGQEYRPNNCANCTQAKILQDTILIIGGNRGFETLGIGINDGRGIKVGNYLLNENLGRKGDYKFSTTPNDRYYTDSLHTGLLSISMLDSQKKIIVGTFLFQAYNPLQDKKVWVSEGKFRLQYKTN